MVRISIRAPAPAGWVTGAVKNVGALIDAT